MRWGPCWHLRFNCTEPESGLKGTSSCIRCCRIVVAGTLLQEAVVPDSAVPFDFQAAYGLNDQTVSVPPVCGVALTGAWDAEA